jgi:hypothetical protein
VGHRTVTLRLSTFYCCLLSAVYCLLSTVCYLLSTQAFICSWSTVRCLLCSLLFAFYCCIHTGDEDAGSTHSKTIEILRKNPVAAVCSWHTWALAQICCCLCYFSRFLAERAQRSHICVLSLLLSHSPSNCSQLLFLTRPHVSLPLRDVA